MSQKILVTGGSGFFGFELVKLLLEKGHEVHILDNNFRGNFKKFSNYNSKKLKLYNCDIRNFDEVNNLVKKVETVFHLAFVNGTRFFYEKPELVLDVGLLGTLNVSKAVANSKKTKKLIFASSSEVYQTPNKIPTSEDVEMKVPNTFNSRYSYGGAKLIGEVVGYNFLLKKNKKYLIFRPHNVFGPQMGFEHVIPDLVKKIFIASKKFKLKNVKIKIQGSGKETRSFCYIDDAVAQLYRLFNFGKNNNIYNIGNSKEISITKLVEIISEILNIKIAIKKSRIQKGSTKRRCPNLNKIKKIGAEVQSKINRKGLEKTVLWYKNYYLKK